MKYTCQICKSKFDASDTYEYRGFYSCAEHHDALIEKVDYRRSEVASQVDKSIYSQRAGSFMNGNTKNIAADGLPIIEIKEPQALKDYENGIL